jgi:signal transduction histidine kinase/CheY-like chemotaxis protein
VRPRLATKINLIVLGVVLLLGSALSAFFILDHQRTLREDLAQRVRIMGECIALNIGDAAARRDVDAMNRALRAAVLDKEVNYVIVKAPDGEILAARWDVLTQGGVEEHDFPLRVEPGTSDRAEPFGAARAAPQKLIGQLAVGVDTTDLQSALVRQIRRSALAVLLAVAASLVLGNFFVRALLRTSVAPLLAGIRAIGSGDLGQTIVPDRHAEIGEIGAAFNAMAGRLAETMISKEQLEDTVRARTAELQAALEERIRLEEQLAQAQKLEGIGILAGGIAHDFNNLLSPILGYADLALRKLEPGHPARGGLAAVVDAANRASELTRQILAFSRKQVLQKRTLDLNEQILAAGKMIRRLIGEDVDVQLNLAQGLPPVEADPTQMQQVLLNLAVNARDAMPGGGRLTVETSVTAIDSPTPWLARGLAPGRYVLLSVTDTGSGMTEETRRRIFEPFFTTKQVGKGTGLGLSTVHGIVKQHGGDIAVYSEVGRGTTFRIYLPCSDAPPPPEAPATAAAAPGPAHGSILLVEDDAAVRDFIATALGESGYEVTSAATAAEALEATRRSAFDLVISDVIMPGMNGRKLYQQIAALRPGARVLFVSGYPAGSGALGELFADGEPFLQKPFTVERLLEQVRERLGKPA